MSKIHLLITCDNNGRHNRRIDQEPPYVRAELNQALHVPAKNKYIVKAHDIN